MLSSSKIDGQRLAPASIIDVANVSGGASKPLRKMPALAPLMPAAGPWARSSTSASTP